MAGGGGVGDGLVGVLVTSLTRLGCGGGSSLSSDMMLRPPLRGSAGRGAAAGGWTGVPAWGVTEPYCSCIEPDDGLCWRADMGRLDGVFI